MSLKTLVKVSEVNNLSDARYCAGMGVEMLGFSLDESHPMFIDLAKLREIALWISGVKAVGEFTGDNVENMNFLAKELNLDYIQLNHPVKIEFLSHVKKPLIQRLNCDDFNEKDIENFLNLYKSYVSYFLIESEKTNPLMNMKDSLKKWCKDFPIIIGTGVDAETINVILEEINPAGIALKGGKEIKPGLKNFDELSSILELLETDN